MTYKELIEIYPWIDLFMELFKGVAPTIVAICAIVINNVAISKREKKNDVSNRQRRQNESQILVLEHMLSKYDELTQMFWKSGTKLLLYLSAEKDKIEKEEFEQSLYEFQFKSREIFNYFKSTMELYDFNIRCDVTLGDVNSFANRLIDIQEKYDNVRKITNWEKKNRLLDEASKEIENETVEVNAWTHVIMQNISKKIKELHEQ